MHPSFNPRPPLSPLSPRREVSHQVMKVIQFEPDRKLLNPNFESYKLCRASEDIGGKVYSIELPIEAYTLCNNLEESFTQLQPLAYKVQLNSLFKNPFSPFEAMYFDINHGLWRLELGEEEVCELVVEGRVDWSKSKLALPPPSLVYLDLETVLLLRGPDPSFEIISLKDSTPQRLIKMPFEILPFELLQLHATFKDVNINGLIRVAISHLYKSNDQSTFDRGIFKVSSLTIDLSTLTTSLEASYQSSSRPLFIRFDKDGLILGGGSIPFVIPPPSSTSPVLEASSSQSPIGVGGGGGTDSFYQTDIKWEQDENNLFITIKVKNDNQVKVEFSVDKLEIFSGDGSTTIVQNTLFANIKDSQSTWSLSDGGTLLLLSLRKDIPGLLWPTLWLEPSSLPLGRDLELEELSVNLDLYSIILTKYPYSNPQHFQWRSAEATYLGSYCCEANCCLLPIDDPFQIGLVIGQGDDALAYTVKNDNFEHVLSFDAINFVQASKQDRRYLAFSPNYAIIIESSRHIFIYQRLKDRKGKDSPQSLVTIDSDQQIIGWSFFATDLLVILTRSKSYMITIPNLII